MPTKCPKNVKKCPKIVRRGRKHNFRTFFGQFLPIWSMLFLLTLSNARPLQVFALSKFAGNFFEELRVKFVIFAKISIAKQFFVSNNFVSEGMLLHRGSSRLARCVQGIFKRENGPLRHSGRRPIQVGIRPIKEGKRPISANGQFSGTPPRWQTAPQKRPILGTKKAWQWQCSSESSREQFRTIWASPELRPEHYHSFFITMLLLPWPFI